MVLTGLKFYALNNLIALDQLLNTILGGAPDETISSRAGKARARGDWWGCYLCLFLDWIDPRHCETSREDDEGSNGVLERLKRDKALEGPFLMEASNMQIDEKTFFKELRGSVFKGGLKQSQVDGLSALLNVWHDDYADYPIEYLAYCLATAYHETGRTMQPVREGFAKTDKQAIAIVTRMHKRGRIKRNYAAKYKKTGKSYFGRGYVQLTWAYNYRRASDKLGIDFYNNPDKALEAENAAHILFKGCIEGWFTSKKLSHYINDKRANYRQARRIVNGMDKASKIARYAKAFEHALEEALDPNKVTVAKLRKAGSRTIKTADRQQDIGGAKVAVGVAVGAAKVKESVSEFEGWAAFGESVKTVVTSFTGLAEWALSAWPMLLVAGGGLLVWNAYKAKKIRVDDEEKIGRLADV